MQSHVEAYLDIETTGLSPTECMVTVVGIYICNGDNTKVIQLVGKDISTQSILGALDGGEVLYTYNGKKFDLPFIYSRLGINLEEHFTHRDLMYDCWKCNLYGGFKAVERQLGIERHLKDMNGYEAVKLWWKYVESFDLDALNKLLEYNKEDVVNLKTLKEELLDKELY
ncbi:ribonuclease H-like domain-containing protein [Chloroflexota bacterium]